MEWIEVLGFTAGTISSITFLPQVIKTWRSRSAKDVSMLMFTFATISVIMWLVYGIYKNSAAIIYTNTMVLIFSLIMLYFKVKYRDEREEKTNLEGL